MDPLGQPETKPVLNKLRADADGLAAARRLLTEGRLVAFPTETVYGLGADATDGRAVAAIYAAKGRPAFNPLIAHVADLTAAQRQGVFSADALALAQAFWPGPLTLVVPVGPACTVSELARAGLSSVALRVPDHPVALALLSAFGKPVAAPSANRSGRVSPTSAQHVVEDLNGRIDMVLDGGATRVGVESTIVAALDGTPRLLRPGGISRAALEAVLGRPLADAEPETDGSQARLAPGRLASHYAPAARVRLGAADLRPDEAILDFGEQLVNLRPQAKAYLDLSAAGDLAEAAANLFGHLRRLDASGVATIAIAPIPNAGLGEAINDRLSRAAAPR